MYPDTLTPGSATTTRIAPAPWHLKGRGFMFLYHFPKSWGDKKLFMPDEQRGTYEGGLGALMLVDYESSEAGPYRELLLIPGKFRWNDYHRHAISRIWVSSPASVVGGRANWGIPKQLAEFTTSNPQTRREHWEVKEDGNTFFSAQVRYGRVPLPMHTALVPFPLLQWLGGKGFLTRFSGYGIGRLATLENLEVNSDRFPDICGRRPLLGLEIEPFFIRFPLPEMVAEAAKNNSATSSGALRTAP